MDTPNVSYRLADLHEAIDHYRSGLKRAQILGHRYWEGVLSNRLGNAFKALGDGAQAERSWRQAVTALAEVGDPDADAVRAKIFASGSAVEQDPGSMPTLLAIQIANYGQMPDELARSINHDLQQIVEASCQKMAIPWVSCHIQHTGDGMLIVAPPEVPRSVMASSLPRELVAAMREYNDHRTSYERLRLHVAVHAGEAALGPHGLTGASVIFLSRLLDSLELRRSSRESDAAMVLVMSDWLYNDAIRPGPDAATYRKMRARIKHTTTSAWIREM